MRPRGLAIALLVCLLGCDGERPISAKAQALGGANLGDLNADGTVNALDLQLETNVILGLQNDPTVAARADLNFDRNVNALDLQSLVNVLLTAGPPAYPAGPYGGTLGDVVPNFIFPGGYWSPFATSGAGNVVGTWMSQITLDDVRQTGRKALLLGRGDLCGS